MALTVHSERVRIPADRCDMEAALWLPDEHIGVILFANSGVSNRLKPPNDYVASVLHDARFGTLWLELLSPQEAHDRHTRSDIGLQTERLVAGCEWLGRHGATVNLPIGVLAAGNAAAAALQLAAERVRGLCAIVLRGGRPDLASHGAIGKVSVPTLMIVGGLEEGAVELNRNAFTALRCKKRLEIIPGATHAFDEPGSLEVAARLARGWFLQHTHCARI
ncbi:MAG TPA: alpha/beta hydrolase [Noviherbaspirillum sp.]|uniref:dienelactone hydrolase family protein n=1 Tax=Noviherbaspirillum sp. TaxID=1926288 RepID=UPI002B460406|nr:alpha/beta hydrolase [Noviherbaspirillum sp.]HJV86019.1 alpha/beta hydrolase [Noviherbaspirillum sp.]